MPLATNPGSVWDPTTMVLKYEGPVLTLLWGNTLPQLLV